MKGSDLMRIVFMGTPDFATTILERLLHSDHDIVLVVSQPDRPIGRKRVMTPPPVKTLAISHRIPVFQPERIRDGYQPIIDAKADLLITAAYGQMLPASLLRAIKAINVHGSLLPAYRGGAPMADQAFRVPSYLADEQAYQLFAQLTGRSGRNVQGEAVIQGYDLDHMAIKGVSEGYRSFYQESLYKRKIMHYPPFGQVAMIQVEGEGYLRTYQEAFTLKKTLLKRLRSVLGPTAARQKKMVSNYRFNLVLKDDDINLEMVFEAINGLKPFVRVTFIPDIDEGK